MCGSTERNWADVAMVHHYSAFVRIDSPRGIIDRTVILGRAMLRAIVIALVGVGGLLFGLPPLSLALTNMAPTERACADYEHAKEPARWLRLTDCATAFSEAAYTTVGTAVTEVYLPVWPATGAQGKRTGLVMASRRPELIALAEALIAAQGDPAAIQAALREHREVLNWRGELNGLVRPGGGLSQAERRDLGQLAEVLSDDFVVLDDGATPDLRLGGALSLLGLVALGRSALSLRRRRARRSAPVAGD